MAGQGGHGTAWRGWARRGRAGRAGHGWARLGMAGRGKARQGGHGAARQGTAGQGGHGTAGQGGAGRGRAGLGRAGLGVYPVVRIVAVTYGPRRFWLGMRNSTALNPDVVVSACSSLLHPGHEVSRNLPSSSPKYRLQAGHRSSFIERWPSAHSGLADCQHPAPC